MNPYIYIGIGMVIIFVALLFLHKKRRI